ncbi:MAG: hypothetical protein HY840_16150 [Bacteroidetes bacterium]|nr:hypothetical protein [Bacteroidota bacterium]
MPFNKINITLTPAEMSSIAAAIDTIINTLPVKYNLTKSERTSLSNINNERYPYVQRAIENHGPANPTLVSGYAGTQAEATNDLVFYDQMKAHLLRLRQAVEIYEDTQQVAGSEAYTWTRMLYNSAKDAAANQVPGADTVADDLATLFGGQGSGTPPPPPVTASITITSDQSILSGMPLEIIITGNLSASGGAILATWESGITNSANLTAGGTLVFQHVYAAPGIKTITVAEVIAGVFAAVSALQIPNVKATSITLSGDFSATTTFNFFGNDLTLINVNALITQINDYGTSGGMLNISGGTMPVPDPAFPALIALRSRGWMVTTN